MLIELEVAKRRSCGWDALVPEGRFWRESWEYHDTDYAELFGTYAFNQLKSNKSTGEMAPRVKNVLSSLPDGPAKKCAIRLQENVCQVVERLKIAQQAVDVAKETLGALSSQHNSWHSPQALRVDFRKALECLDAFENTARLMPALGGVDNEFRDRRIPLEAIERFLWPFVLHPVWETTEAAASVAAELRITGRDEIDSLIEGWADCADYWQARYAAVDAAHNSRDFDARKSQPGELFRKLVVEKRLHSDSTRRVRFICAEDLFLASNNTEKELEADYPKKPSDAEKERIIRRPSAILSSFEFAVKWWFKNADDCTLLDEIFQYWEHLTLEDDGSETQKWYRSEASELLSRWFEEAEPNRLIKIVHNHLGRRNAFLKKIHEIRHGSASP
jgi:hypothetical protein